MKCYILHLDVQPFTSNKSQLDFQLTSRFHLLKMVTLFKSVNTSFFFEPVGNSKVSCLRNAARGFLKLVVGAFDIRESKNVLFEYSNILLHI